MKPILSSCSPGFHPWPAPRRLHNRDTDLESFVCAVLAPAEPVLAGVSGGGDSMSLLLQLAPIARAHGRRLVAGIVDHGLREGSAGDAERAAALAADLGAEAHVLRAAWPEGPRPAQAQARAARYVALAGLARTIDARTLFLGHTLDDQAETIFMRRAAGSGARGLTGMAAHSPCPVWPEGRDLQLARPLLGRRRAELREMLRTAGASWIEDPANAQVRYARVRARAELARSGEAAALVASVARAAEEATRNDRDAADWLTGAVFREGEILVSDPGAGVSARGLAVLAASAGGAVRTPTDAAAARLAAQLQRAGAGTLGGAAFRRAAGQLLVRRDRGGLHGRRGGGSALAPMELPARQAIVWDRRLELTAPSPGWTADPPLGSGNGGGAPRLRHVGTPCDGRVTSRWLLRDRVAQLLWRANCSLFTVA